MSKITKKFPGVSLVLDHADAATPAMVYAGPRDRYSSSYDCAIGEGTVGSGQEYTLTDAQYKWLESQSDLVEAAYNAARKDHPEYS
jgi:hypothetical protein